MVPADDTTKGKFPASLTAKQLRRKKVEAMKLCVSFAYATKHYLRGEDGLDWADYAGILPQSVIRLAQSGTMSSSRRTSEFTSYNATAKTSTLPSEFPSTLTSRAGTPKMTGTPEDTSGDEATGDNETIQGRHATMDATKRVRVKRSKDGMKTPGVRSAKTPLLSTAALHQTIDFHPEPETLTTPLPLVYVVACFSL